jgi:hypothetical protein
MRVGTVGTAIGVGRHKLLKLLKAQKWAIFQFFLLVGFQRISALQFLRNNEKKVVPLRIAINVIFL